MARLRDLAPPLGITERTVQDVLADLRAAGLITVTPAGRRNRYAVHLDRPGPTGSFPRLTVARVVAFLQGGPLSKG
jgi:hypothetical protein